MKILGVHLIMPSMPHMLSVCPVDILGNLSVGIFRLCTGHLLTLYIGSLFMPSTSNEDNNVIIENCPVFQQACGNFN